MDVRISARNVEVSPKEKEQVSREVERLTRFFDQIIDAHVTIAQEKHRHTVDVRLHVNGRSYQAQSAGPNLKLPLDEAVMKLQRQLERHKSKQRRQTLRGEEVLLRGKAVDVTGAVPELPPLPVTEELPRRMRRNASTRRKT